MYMCIYEYPKSSKGDRCKRRSYPRVGMRYQRKCTLQHTATHCNMWPSESQSAELRGVYVLRMCRLQHVQHSTTQYNTLQHTATCGKVEPQSTEAYLKRKEIYTATHCNTLQQTTAQPNMWQVETSEYRTTRMGRGVETHIQHNGHSDCLLLFAFGQIQSAKSVCARVCFCVCVCVSGSESGSRWRGGGLGSSTIFKKFNEPYAPSSMVLNNGA